MATTNVWAIRYAKAIVKSEPSNGGYVYVSSSNSAPGTYDRTSDESEQKNNKVSAYTFTFYRFYATKPNYVFKGWAESSTANSGSTSSSVGIAGDLFSYSGATKTYYAIFARMTANTSNLAFAETYVGQSAAQTITISHAHAGQITAVLSGDHAGDFRLSSSTPVSNSVSEGTQNITVTFAPVCNGTRTAVLTLKSNNGLNNVAISLTGEALLNEQSLSWDGEPVVTDIVVSNTTTLSATATSGLPVTYTSDNEEVLSVSGNTLTAHKIGQATITATQAGDCTYAPAASITKTFTVADKYVPTFWLNGDPDLTEASLLVGESVFLVLNHTDAQLEIDADSQLGCSLKEDTLTVNALLAGDATLILTQPETNLLQYATRTFTFRISKHTASLLNTLETEYKVEDSIALAKVYTATNSEVPVTVESSDEEVLKVVGDKLVALKAGVATITVAQAETYKWSALSAAKTVTVSKYTASLLNTLETECKVEDSIALAKVYSATNSEVPVTIESSDEEVLKVIGDKLVALKAGTATITVAQAETYKWSALSAAKTVTVSKYANAIVWQFGSETATSKTLAYDEGVRVSYSSSNPDTAACPIRIEQTAGTEIAAYYAVQSAIYASYRNGVATWSVTQPENEKYLAAEAMITVRVTAMSTACDVAYRADAVEINNWSTGGEITWTDENSAETLSFEANKSMATAVGDLKIYANYAGNWKQIQSIGVGDLEKDSYKSFSYKIDPSVTGIRFENGGSYKRHVRNLRVSRYQHLTPSATTVALPVNELGGQTQAALEVAWSSCADEIKVVSSNPKFTVDKAAVSTEGGAGKTVVTITYASDSLDESSADITLYTLYQQVKITATGRTEKKTQTIVWATPDTIRTTDALALDATAETAIAYAVERESEGVATLDEGGRIVIRTAGTLKLTATASESDDYKPATLTRTIEVVKVVPIIRELPALSALTYGQTLAEVVVSGGAADREGVFVLAEEDKTQVLGGGEHAVKVQFQPTDSLWYAVADSTAILVVNPAEQFIDWATEDLPSSVVVGAVVELTAVASSGLAVGYSVEPAELASVDGEVLTAVATGWLTVTATQAGNADYRAAEPVYYSLEINSPTPTGTDLVPATEQPVRKVLLKGNLYIIRGNDWYDLQGRRF